jgi:hypothetical protein
VKTLLLILATGGMLAQAGESTFACDRAALSPQARRRHFEVLGPALRAAHRSARQLPNGVEFEFPPDDATVEALNEWVAGERRCCPFFDIELRFEHENGEIWLRLTGREGTKQFVQSEFAAWFR